MEHSFLMDIIQNLKESTINKKPEKENVSTQKKLKTKMCPTAQKILI